MSYRAVASSTEQDPKLREFIGQSAFTWKQIRSDMNPPWNYISVGRRRRADDARNPDGIRLTLERIPR